MESPEATFGRGELMIVIIDYGMGNVGSILNMLKKIGAEEKISNVPEEI